MKDTKEKAMRKGQESSVGSATRGSADLKPSQDCQAKGSKAEDKVCKKCGRVFTTDWIDKRIKYKLQEQIKEVEKDIVMFNFVDYTDYEIGVAIQKDLLEKIKKKYSVKEEGRE